MSFSWKGLLGVNQSSAASSTTSAPSAPGSHQASASPASHALPIGTPGSSVGGSVASPTSAGSSAMSPPSARAPLNSNPFAAAQPAAPAVPLFGGMIPSSNSFHSTSYIPSSSATTQSSVISRKPSEIPVNAAEGGGYLLGMENFGNTCYVNSMLQSLYFCRPFRDSVLSYNVAHRDRSESDPDHPRSHHDSVDSAAPTPLKSTSEPADGIPPADTLFAALRDLFEVIQQSGHQKSLSSPTRLTAPGSLPLSSPTTPSPPSLGSADPPNVARRTSILGRPSTAGGIAGRGGAGNHIAANQAGSTAAAAAQAIPIAASSSAGAAPPTLSVSTSSTGTLALGFPAVDSNAVKAFLGTLKRENVLFDSTMHQDAHEMLNFVLNKVGEDLIDADKARTRVKMQSRNPYLNARSESDKTVDAHRRNNVMEVGPSGKTCVHRLFEGVLTNETRCLTCETITSRDECFLDLSIDIEQNSSVTSCLRQFSASEMLRSRNKFFCDSCSGLQEAEKRMKIKKLPNLLALHLKRFKYEETVQRYVKLAYRVVFPLELRLFNTSDDAEDPDRLYELCAIVVHIGAGPHHGHYIAVVKVGDRWVQFDDDVVTYIDEAEIAKYYGDRPGLGSAYVLFYQAVDLDFDGLGLVDPAIQATIQQKMAMNGRTNGRGRAGSTTTDPIDTRQHVPSPERAGGAALPNRSRLDSVTEGSPLVAGGAGGSGGAEAGQGANGWFGSFRNRDKRAGSQSKRRPKTTSAVDPLPAGATVVLASAASADPTKLGLGDVEGTTPDNASISTHSTSANEGVPRGITTASASITPSTELTGSAILPGSQAADGEADASPARHGAMTTTPASEVLSSRGTTESPSESKYSRMIGNQADAAANREAREQNLMRGIMNRRARAASEGFPSPGVLSEAAWGTTGPLLSHGQPMLGGGLVADPEEAAHAGHAAHTVVTPSAIDSGASPASTFPIASQREGPSGPSFAPLERLLSKKDAKTRNARRASSGYTPMSPGTEKKEGMLSNLFSSSSSTSSAAQSKRNSMQQMPAGSPSEGGAAAGDALPPSRKPSITTRTISKTFGFGRKQT